MQRQACLYFWHSTLRCPASLCHILARSLESYAVSPSSMKHAPQSTSGTCLLPPLYRSLAAECASSPDLHPAALARGWIHLPLLLVIHKLDAIWGATLCTRGEQRGHDVFVQEYREQNSGNSELVPLGTLGASALAWRQGRH